MYMFKHHDHLKSESANFYYKREGERERDPPPSKNEPSFVF